MTNDGMTNDDMTNNGMTNDSTNADMADDEISNDDTTDDDIGGDGYQVDISAKNRLKKLRQNKQEGELTGPEFEERLRNRWVTCCSVLCCTWYIVSTCNTINSSAVLRV